MTEPGAQFGSWLRRKLLERHLSLAQLCRTVGCDYTYLWRIIHAETAQGRRYLRPSLVLTRRIGEALAAPREALAAAGYGEEEDVREARLADKLSRLEQDLRSLRTEVEPRAAGAWARLPLLGRVPAGELQEALENAGEFIELPIFVAGEAEYALRVTGESMQPTLLDGDVVTVRPQLEAAPGQIVVAAVDEEVTLKRYELMDGLPTLVADNPGFGSVRCGPRVRLIGVVTGSFRPPEVLQRRPERP